MPLETVEVVAPAPVSNSAAGASPAPGALQLILQAIAGDAAAAPGEYLRDTEVPHGGE